MLAAQKQLKEYGRLGLLDEHGCLDEEKLNIYLSEKS